MAAVISVAAEAAQDPASAFVGPIAGTGIVGVVFLMVIQRWKIMPTYVYDEAKVVWDQERARILEEKQRIIAELLDAREGLKEANAVYTQQVIPTLTRVLDAERELLDLKREEQASRRRPER